MKQDRDLVRAIKEFDDERMVEDNGFDDSDSFDPGGNVRADAAVKDPYTFGPMINW